ncbi:MAG: biotin/lipoyl-binding protein [Fischerella sp. CENA71]|nr:biotin/lipoyl-binding protein [Fischerella sp. CENA71]
MIRQPTTESVINVPVDEPVTALGRLQPVSEVVRVAPPTTSNNDRVAQLLVKRGDRVQANQVIAILDSRDRLQTALLQARKQVSVAQARLAQVKAGAQSGQIAAQKAEIMRLEEELQGEIATQTATIARRQSEVNVAQAEHNRYLALYQEGAIAASMLDQRRLTLETAQAQLNEVKANRIAGQVLEVHTKAGEAITSTGIVALGTTEQMEVVAEIYQTDIGKVRTGQSGVITSEAFSGELRGIVQWVGLQVSQQEVFNNQPGENLDRRVVDVRIRLDEGSSKRVVSLTNLQVQVRIQP